MNIRKDEIRHYQSMARHCYRMTQEALAEGKIDLAIYRQFNQRQYARIATEYLEQLVNLK